MRRLATGFGLGVAIFVTTVLAVGAPAGLPEVFAPYQSWTKMNAVPLTDPSNPRAGPKNTFINLDAGVLRSLIGRGARTRAPFHAGTVIVRETLDVDAGFVRVLFVMERDAAQTRTRGWKFSGLSRTAANQAFQPIAIADPVARCLNCHLQMGASDLVFTPFLNRRDALPGRTPTSGDRVEIFNYLFGPQTLRVRAGTTVAFVNYDAVVHDVKAADRSFESGNLPAQGRYFQTFTRPQTVQYFCAVLLEMRGQIVVEP
jgi:plastocyanin